MEVGTATATSAELLAAQQSAQADAMSYQTEATKLSTEFQMHAASQKTLASVSAAISSLSNQLSQNMSRA